MVSEPTRHALIVEDEGLLLDALAASLRRIEWLRISKSRTAEDALAMARADPPDIVITDVRMPGMGGFDLIEQIRRVQPDVPVLVMTAYGVHLQREAMRRGATCFLEKPFRMSELRGVLQTLLMRTSTAMPPRDALGFEGRIESLSVADVVQVVCLGRQSARIDVRALDGAQGAVYVRDGALIDAELDDRRGTEAFLALAVLERGSFRVRPDTTAVPATIQGSWQALVMEAMRLYDEARAGAPSGPASDAMPPLAAVAPASRGAPPSRGGTPSRGVPRLASYRPTRPPVTGSDFPGADTTELPQPPSLPREASVTMHGSPDSIELPLAEERPPSMPPPRSVPAPAKSVAPARAPSRDESTRASQPPSAPPSSTVEGALRAAADAMRAGRREAALRVLEEASRTWPGDRRVRANLSRLERMREGQP